MQVFLKSKETYKDFKSNLGNYFDINQCKIYRKRVDIFDADTKQLVASYYPRYINENTQKLLGQCVIPFNHKLDSGMRKQVRPKNSKRCPSYVYGFYDKKIISKNPKYDMKGDFRQTKAMTMGKNQDLWTRIIHYVDLIFKINHRDYYTNQYNLTRKNIDATLYQSIFSTITINYSLRTSIHTDAQNYKDGLGVIIVCPDPEHPHFGFKGGELLLPRYRIGFPMQYGDLLFFDSKEYHCNAELTGEPAEYKCGKKFWKNQEHRYNRISFVFYAREDLYK